MWLVALFFARSVGVTVRAAAEARRNGRAAFEVSSLAYLLRHGFGSGPFAV
jgi:hypothetical protein